MVEDHRRTIESVARNLCRGGADASDLVQDTYERAWRNLASLRDDARARAWLTRILRRCFIDRCRRRRREVAVAALPDRPDTASIERTPAWERVTVEDLRRALARLDEPFRSVAILHDLDGLSCAAISRSLGIAYATVATRLHRAHLRVRHMLKRELDREE